MGSAFEITRTRTDQRPVLELDALARPDRRDGHAARDLGAGLDRGVADRKGDHAHAALDVAPRARVVPVELAHVVHQVDHRRALVLWPAVGGDEALAVERVLDPLVVHVRVEHVGDRRFEDEVDQVRIAQHLLELGARGGVADPGVPLALAELAAGAVERLAVGLPALDVLVRDAEVAKPREGLLLVVELDERGAVVEGDEERRVGDGDLDAALAEAKLGDHELVENADDVGAGAHDVALVGERPLQRAGPADALAPLEHEDALAFARQVRGGGQAVVAAADDDDVPVLRGQLGDGAGEPQLTQLLGDGVHHHAASGYASHHREVTTFLRV